MELLPAGVPLSFEVTFDADDLDVAMLIFDDSGMAPVLAESAVAMVNLPGTYTYRGKFTALNGKNYIVVKAVFTDGTYTTLSPDYSQGSESFIARYLPPAAGAGAVVGLVNC